MVFFLVTTKLQALDKECLKYYYGIGVPVDYSKAMDCFQKDDIGKGYPFLILMYLNGDGVERNPQKAQELFEEADNKLNYWGVGYQNLEKIIQERLKTPQKIYPRLTCNDIPMDSDESYDCNDIQTDLNDQELNRKVETFKGRLNDMEKKELKIIEDEAETLEINDGKRAVLDLMEEDILGISDEHPRHTYGKALHQDKIKDWLLKGQLNVSTLKECQEARRNLNKSLQTAFKKIIEEKELFETQNKGFSNYPKYDPGLEEDQKGWELYRDAWVRLLEMVKTKGVKDNVVIENSVVTQLCRDRIKELNGDLAHNENVNSVKRWMKHKK